MTQIFTRYAIAPLAIGLLSLGGVCASASAADTDTRLDSATPVSASQAALLRNAPDQSDALRASDPSHEDVPATRSQIELLDRSQARVSAMDATASIR
ncbi:hypothetical protein [Salinisphaera sp. T31B1]|uniref:hypothetical protein n=1 Tax=Salinisphaera sp. T31B1 TaxID=727963 RepID=UPI003342B351